MAQSPLAPQATSTDNAAASGRREVPCESGTRGRSSTADAKMERQLYANCVIREWQRTHPILPFADLLSLFRLAGKEWDRYSGLA